MPAEPERGVVPDETGGRLAPLKVRYAPAYLVVTADTGLVRFFDGPVSAYLSPSAGPATLALFGLLRDDLHGPLRQALMQVADTRLPASRRVAIGTDELTIRVEPLPRQRDGAEEPLLLVVGLHPHPAGGTAGGRCRAHARPAGAGDARGDGGAALPERRAVGRQRAPEPRQRELQ